MNEIRRCPNPNHDCATVAIATVTFPDGQFRPTEACAGCLKTIFTQAMAEGRPLNIDPIPSAYGICPTCHERVRRRPSGLIAAHPADRWSLRVCAGRASEPEKENTSDG